MRAKLADLAIPEPLGDCVLWFAGVDWEAVKGTDRQLVEAMDQPVVWVESVSPVRPRGRWLPAKWGGVQVIRTDPLLVRVTATTLPLNSRPGIRATNGPLTRVQVRSVLRALGATPRTVVFSYLHDLSGGWGADAVELLLGTDDFVAGSQLMGLSTKWLVRREKPAVCRADVVLTVSEGLAARWRQVGAEPLVLPNGCSPIPKESLAQYQDVSSWSVRDKRPVVGLVGQLSSRIDIDVLEAISDSGARLLLVGPKDPRWEPSRFEALISRESVTYVGRVPADSVPGFLRQMDVGITPYADSTFNKASFPLKTLEYLGAGLPVVTSDLPASHWLEDEMARYIGAEAVARHLAVATSTSDFVAQISRLSAMRSIELDRQRWEFATEHSWSSRAQRLLSIADGARAQRANS